MVARMASSLFFSREGKEEETVSARETKHRSTGARFRGVRGETSIETKKLLPAGQIGERSSLGCTRVPGKWKWYSNERRRLGTSSLIRKNVHPRRPSRDVNALIIALRILLATVHAINSTPSWNVLIPPFFSSIVYRVDEASIEWERIWKIYIDRSLEFSFIITHSIRYR